MLVAVIGRGRFGFGSGVRFDRAVGMAVFDHARRCLRRRLSVVMVGRRACRMHLRCRFIVVVMVIAHLHGGSRLGWRVVVRWRAGWMLVARSFGCLVVMVGGDALPIGMGLRFTAAV